MVQAQTTPTNFVTKKRRLLMLGTLCLLVPPARGRGRGRGSTLDRRLARGRRRTPIRQRPPPYRSTVVRVQRTHPETNDGGLRRGAGDEGRPQLHRDRGAGQGGVAAPHRLPAGRGPFGRRGTTHSARSSAASRRLTPAAARWDAARLAALCAPTPTRLSCPPLPLPLAPSPPRPLPPPTIDRRQGPSMRWCSTRG